MNILDHSKKFYPLYAIIAFFVINALVYYSVVYPSLIYGSEDVVFRKKIPNYYGCNRSCEIISWQRTGGIGNQLDTIFPNMAYILNLGCCIVPPTFRAYHGHGDHGDETYLSYGDLFDVEKLSHEFPGQIHKLFSMTYDQEGFCSCPENRATSPYNEHYRLLGMKVCQRTCLSILSEVLEGNNDVNSRSREDMNSTTMVKYNLNIDPDVLSDLHKMLVVNKKPRVESSSSTKGDTTEISSSNSSASNSSTSSSDSRVSNISISDSIVSNTSSSISDGMSDDDSSSSSSSSRSSSSSSSIDYQDFQGYFDGLRLCPKVTDFSTKLTQALSHGSVHVQQKIDDLRHAMGVIHGTVHIRQGDYYYHCASNHWSGCAPDWPGYIKQVRLACLEVGVRVGDGTCRVYVGTEDSLHQLPDLGCQSKPRIEFICENCERKSRECLQVIPFIPFKSKPGWSHSGFAGAIADQIVMYNDGKGFFIGNQYSSYSAQIFRMRVAKAAAEAALEASDSHNNASISNNNKQPMNTTLAVWSPKSGWFDYPRHFKSDYYCESWGSILDRFRP